MTMIDVRECEAGPAVDAACAREMGWIKCRAVEWRGHIWRHECYSPTNKRWDRLRPYSSYIAAARELVEAMRDDGSLEDDATEIQRKFINALVDLLGVDNSLLYYDACEWLTYRALWVMVSVEPLAICRAFLLASGVTEIEIKDHGIDPGADEPSRNEREVTDA